MAVLDMLPFSTEISNVVLSGTVILVFLTLIFLFAFVDAPKSLRLPETTIAYAQFIYGCFLKPHSKKGDSQQDALESFYKSQAAAYDATRGRLLSGREEMLGMVAAQLQQKPATSVKPVWVDVSVA